MADQNPPETPKSKQDDDQPSSTGPSERLRNIAARCGVSIEELQRREDERKKNQKSPLYSAENPTQTYGAGQSSPPTAPYGAPTPSTAPRPTDLEEKMQERIISEEQQRIDEKAQREVDLTYHVLNAQTDLKEGHPIEAAKHASTVVKGAIKDAVTGFWKDTLGNLLDPDDKKDEYKK